MVPTQRWDAIVLVIAVNFFSAALLLHQGRENILVCHFCARAFDTIVQRC